MSRRAYVEISKWEATRGELLKLARAIDSGKRLPEADYHLAFADAAQLLGELPPKRIQTLRAVQAMGATSIYALAKRLKRNYSNVHTDVRRLMFLGLLEKDAAGRVFVPFEDVIVKIDASLLKAA